MDPQQSRSSFLSSTIRRHTNLSLWDHSSLIPFHTTIPLNYSAVFSCVFYTGSRALPLEAEQQHNFYEIFDSLASDSQIHETESSPRLSPPHQSCARLACVVVITLVCDKPRHVIKISHHLFSPQL